VGAFQTREEPYLDYGGEPHSDKERGAISEKREGPFAAIVEEGWSSVVNSSDSPFLAVLRPQTPCQELSGLKTDC
jgi:hypothetical protein